MLPLSFRSALRQFTRYPGFVFVAVSTLALGIGANTAFFTVLNNALLRPLPYLHQDRIVFLNERSQSYDEMSVSYPNFVDWHTQQDAFSSLALFSITGVMLKTDSGTERVLGLASGWAVVRLLQSQLFNTAPNDLPSYAVATLLLLIVGAIASYLPALRAVRINPVDAIRTE